MSLNCFKCNKNIKPNSEEHDNCILINDGEDLVCQDCSIDYEEEEEEEIDYKKLYEEQLKRTEELECKYQEFEEIEKEIEEGETYNMSIAGWCETMRMTIENIKNELSFSKKDGEKYECDSESESESESDEEDEEEEESVWQHTYECGGEKHTYECTLCKKDKEEEEEGTDYKRKYWEMRHKYYHLEVWEEDIKVDNPEMYKWFTEDFSSWKEYCYRWIEELEEEYHFQINYKSDDEDNDETEDEDESDEEDDREYTIEKQVCGMGFMSFYDEKDMLEQITYCKNGCWKLKNDKTARDLDGELCITEDEED